MFQETGRYNEAIYCLTEALRLEPLNIDLWKLNGSIYSLMKKYSAAIACYDEALKIDSDNIEALESQSWIFNKLGMMQEENKCNEKIRRIKERVIDSDA
jgi:tetratricopeptide (TPR) repeat protein